MSAVQCCSILVFINRREKSNCKKKRGKVEMERNANMGTDYIRQHKIIYPSNPLYFGVTYRKQTNNFRIGGTEKPDTQSSLLRNQVCLKVIK